MSCSPDRSRPYPWHLSKRLLYVTPIAGCWRASAPTIRWIRGSLFYAALFRQWLSFPDIGRYRSSWPFEGDFTNWNSEPFVPSTRTVAISFSVLPRHGLHGVNAPLCHRVIIHGVDVYFERSGRRSPPNMPCRLRGSRFCRDVSRGTFLITRSEHAWYFTLQS